MIETWKTDFKLFAKSLNLSRDDYKTMMEYIDEIPAVQPELTDEQSIAHLQSSGWMQRHDKEMYESGLKEQLADDSDSYDSLLSSVQPDHTTESGKKVCVDTISRQAAIDTVKTYWKKVVDDIPKGVGFEELTQLCDMALKHNANILKAIDQLPSAQPERTCVNCGRTVNNGGRYADGRTRCPIEEHYALPKDGYCHLWEKRNVTDDDYPERREVDGERRTDE